NVTECEIHSPQDLEFTATVSPTLHSNETQKGGRERERERERECVCERERECVCEREREREGVCVCVSVMCYLSGRRLHELYACVSSWNEHPKVISLSLSLSLFVCLCVCVCVCVSVCVCVCVCVWGCVHD